MAYPPAQHLLRDLLVSTYWPGELESRFCAPLVPQVADSTGAMSAGALFAIADFAAASTAIAGAGDDWAGTLDLSVRMAKPLTAGPLVIDGEVIRAGGTLISVRSELYDGHGAEEPAEYIGMTIGGFRRMPRNQEFNAGPAERHEIGVRQEVGLATSGFTHPIADQLGLTEVSPGVIELEKSPYVTNSFGTINGGTTGIIICAGAESAVGPDYVARDVDVRYIGQAKQGPVRTMCEVLRQWDDHAVVEVSMVDMDRDRRLVAAGTVTLLRGGPRE